MTPWAALRRFGKRADILFLSTLLWVSFDPTGQSAHRSTAEIIKTSQLLRNENGIHFFPVPLVRQSRSFSCGAAALQSVLSYYGLDFREGQLERTLRTSYDEGTSIEVMADFVRRILNDKPLRQSALDLLGCDEDPQINSPDYQRDCVGNPAKSGLPDGVAVLTGKPPADSEKVAAHEIFSAELFMGKEKHRTLKPLSVPDGELFVPSDGLTVKELETHVRNHRPVIVDLQAWPEEPSPPKGPRDWENDWEDGHYVVVIGYDRKNFYLMDPSVPANWSYLPRQELIKRWHDFYTLPHAKDPAERLFARHQALVISRARPEYRFPHDAIPKTE